VVGELWKHRNKRIFRDGRIDHNEIFTLAEVKAWSWIKSKAHGVCFSFSNWFLKPLVCMKSVKSF